MKCAHKVLGFSSYKMTTIKIMSEMKLLTIHHMIIYETILFFHKGIFNNYPDSITKLITYGVNDRNNVRSCRKPTMIKSHTSEKVTNSLLHRALFFYNKLDYDIRLYNPKKLARYLKSNIIYMFPNNKIPKYEKS